MENVISLLRYCGIILGVMIPSMIVLYYAVKYIFKN